MNERDPSELFSNNGADSSAPEPAQILTDAFASSQMRRVFEQEVPGNYQQSLEVLGVPKADAERNARKLQNQPLKKRQLAAVHASQKAAILSKNGNGNGNH